MSANTRRILLGSVALLLLAAGSASAQTCSPQWFTDAFGLPGVPPPATVNRLAIFDDGSGPALYASGPFQSIGGVSAMGIAKWNGEHWSPLGSGLGGRVTAIAEYDGYLYASGSFNVVSGSPSMARWDGQTWRGVGGGLTRSTGIAQGFAMAVYDPGTGPSLYVGGAFEFAGGQPAVSIARWDGTSWHNAGDSQGTVNVFLIWDDGTGEALYAGGNISMIGGVQANGIAKLSGTTWSALGDGIMGGPQGFGRVNSLAAFDDGTGEALYVGGEYTSAGGNPAEGLARWTPATGWSTLPGGGVTAGPSTGTNASTMAVFDDGNGPALFIGGTFGFAGGIEVNNIARFDGTNWSHLEGGVTNASVTTVSALLVHDDGSGLGPALHIAGGFDTAGGQPAGSLSRWICMGVCYPDCDGNEVLNVDDFVCFINEFAAAQALPPSQQITSYVNCTGSTTEPILTIDDFICFIDAFAAGCP